MASVPITTVNTVQDPSCTPIQLACPGYAVANNTNFNGPFPFGGALYVFGQRANEAVVPSSGVVFKSLDGGVTWTEQDAAGEVIMRPAGTSWKIPVVFDAVNGFIHICYEANASPFHLFYIRYDMNTDTWGVAVDSGVVISTAIASGRMCLRSDGTLVFLYPRSATHDIRYVVITNQVFGTFTTLLTGSDAFVDVYACAPDVNDKVFIIYRTSSTTTAMVTLTTGGVVSAPSTIGAIVPSACSWILLWVEQDKILVPYTTPFNAGDLDASNKARFWEGSTIGDAPTWTVNDLHDGLPTTIDGSIVRDRSPLVVQFDATTVYFFFSLEGLVSPDPGSIVSQYYVTYDGTTIDTPVLVWDEITDPASGATGLDDGDYYILGTSVFVDGNTFRLVAYAAANQDLQGSLTYFEFDVEVPPVAADEAARLQIFDDGAGEYIFDAPVNSLSCSGAMTQTVNTPAGPFILPSPLSVCKPGLLTIALTNVSPIDTTAEVNAGASIQVCAALVFAVPKKCKGQTPDGARQIEAKGVLR